jgi:NADPH-dependent 2,4-dienoyl-CoA reductase/sulfur reductase-like enzyme
MSSVRRHFDVVVAGAGPAGLAAAACAAENAARVAIVDDNPALGGQIWRGEFGSASPEAAEWIARLEKTGVELFPGTRVFDEAEANVLRAEARNETIEFAYRKLIIATGARERFLPFPGWTLANVMGAGGLQALVKSGLPIQGKRVVVAGSGPLLLAVAAYLRKHGAEIVKICEQASWASLAVFGANLLRHSTKLTEGLGLHREMRGIEFIPGCWPVRADGDEVLRTVVVSRKGKHETVECDYLACGFHLVPNTELASLLGCELGNGFVDVDDLQTTSRADVYCAGEPTGIGGVESAVVQGKIAGLVAVGRRDEAKKFFGQRRKHEGFARALERTFWLRSELKTLPEDDTIVCRCEDVTYGRLKTQGSWRAAKLQTRCGMGPCQGRVCGPATEFLCGWKIDSTRPPLFPVDLEHLCGAAAAHTGSKTQS